MMKCRLVTLHIHPDIPDIMVAEIIRLESHPRLGVPSGGITKTSQIKQIDCVNRIIITQNSIYYYGE